MSRKRQVVSQLSMLLMLLALSVGMQAQSEGENAIYTGSTTTPGASTAYIDVYPFYTSDDICLAINAILTASWYTTTNYPGGAVIDARGILPLLGGSSYVTCGSNPFPSTTLPPTTVLLPGETIQIYTTWILPSNTRIVGEGTGPDNYTTLQVVGGSIFSGKAMIQMGINSSTPATGVVVEHLTLQGSNSTQVQVVFDGIDNVSAGDGSYVDSVDIYGIGPLTNSGSISGTACTPSSGAVTALCISPGATYSGPYTNLNIAPANNCSNNMCPNTACVKVQAQTRGLRNITCVGGSTSTYWPAAAIYLDSYATTIENVHVEAFFDAIVVGDYADGQGVGQNTLQVDGSTIPVFGGNTIATVTGSFAGGSQLRNAVHICNGALSTGSACSTNKAQVRDLVVTQAISNGNNNANNPVDAAAIQDDILGWTGGVNLSGGPAYVGLYVIGTTSSTSATGGYARFTTSPTGTTVAGATLPSPTWGAGAPGNLGSTSCASSGAIFSATNGNTNGLNTIYVCSNYSSGSLKWTAIGN